MDNPPTFRGHYSNIPTGGQVIPDDNECLGIRCVMRIGAAFPLEVEWAERDSSHQTIVPGSDITREGTLSLWVQRSWPLVNY